MALRKMTKDDIEQITSMIYAEKKLDDFYKTFSVSPSETGDLQKRKKVQQFISEVVSIETNKLISEDKFEDLKAFRDKSNAITEEYSNVKTKKTVSAGKSNAPRFSESKTRNEGKRYFISPITFKYISETTDIDMMKYYKEGSEFDIEINLSSDKKTLKNITLTPKK